MKNIITKIKNFLKEKKDKFIAMVKRMFKGSGKRIAKAVENVKSTLRFVCNNFGFRVLLFGAGVQVFAVTTFGAGFMLFTGICLVCNTVSYILRSKNEPSFIQSIREALDIVRDMNTTVIYDQCNTEIDGQMAFEA